VQSKPKEIVTSWPLVEADKAKPTFLASGRDTVASNPLGTVLDPNVPFYFWMGMTVTYPNPNGNPPAPGWAIQFNNTPYISASPEKKVLRVEDAFLGELTQNYFTLADDGYSQDPSKGRKEKGSPKGGVAGQRLTITKISPGIVVTAGTDVVITGTSASNANKGNVYGLLITSVCTAKAQKQDNAHPDGDWQFTFKTHRLNGFYYVRVRRSAPDTDADWHAFDHRIIHVVPKD
jgi:hypothetical protein